MPTFRPWRDQDLGCLQLCACCRELEPCRPNSRFPLVPGFRPPRPLPGREWVLASSRAGVWGWFGVWALCGGLAVPILLVVLLVQGQVAGAALFSALVAVPAVWMLHRWTVMATCVGTDAIATTGFLRTRVVRWPEIAGFEIVIRYSDRQVRARTIRNALVNVQVARLGNGPDRDQEVAAFDRLAAQLRART